MKPAPNPRIYQGPQPAMNNALGFAASSATRWRSVPASFRLGAVLSLGFIIEGLVVKSFYFLNDNPIVAHYAVSSLISMVALAILFLSVGMGFVSGIELLLFISAVSLSFVSSIVSGQAQNMVATATFALSVLMSYFAVPRLLEAADVDLIKFLRLVFGVITAGSAILLVAMPSIAWDANNGRFNGTMISVAVACNVFFIASVLFGDHLRSSQSLKWRLYTAAQLCLAVGLLFLTYTRSLLLEAVAMLFIFMITTQAGTIKLGSLVKGLSLLMVILFAGLLFAAIWGVDMDQLLVSFRLADGGSATDSRMGNWLFALDRIYESPWFGEGMLTKHSLGDSGIAGDVADATYSVMNDPHSLPLSFAVEAGIPFAMAMMGFLVLVLLRHLRQFGISKSVGSVDFMICAFIFVGMIPGGGDLTSMGNAIDRIFWILLGCLALRSNRAAMQGNRISSPHPPASLHQRLGR